MTDGRVHCLVPHCRRTASRERLRRKLREKPKVEVQLHSIDNLIHRLWVRNWEACKAAAIEAAGGI